MIAAGPDGRRRRAAFKLGSLAVGVVVAVSACVGVVPAAPPPQPPPPRPSVPLLSIAHWQALFDREATAESQSSLQLSRSTDSWDFYTLSYEIDAYAGMFEATGEAKYADFALEYVENMVASASPSSSFPDSDFKDQYLGWTSQQPDVRGQEVALYESYSWRYVTRLLRLLRLSPLYDDSRYRGQYDRLLEFTELNVFEKWYSRGPDDFIYRSRTHLAAHWAYVALDLVELTTAEDRKGRYREVVDKIDNSLRGQLRASEADPEAFWWSDVWGEMDGPGQDVGHGNGVISYVVEARDLKAGWSADELARFSRTFTSFVLRSGKPYPEYVDGSGSENGWIADGFVKLGRYSSAIQAALHGYPVQNNQYYAAMAVNAKLLGTNGG